MADDVLRLRATVVNEEFLANIRVMGRELGLLGQKGGTGVKQINREFQTLSSTIKRIGGELRSVVPAFGGIGLGAAGIGLAVGSLFRTFTDVAKRVTELKYASRELGMSERDIRAWGLAAEKVGVSAESMTQGLTNFKRNTDGLRYNIGGLRSELYQLGAGPVVAAMQAATTQADKMKAAFDFKEVLNQSDPSGYKARHFFDLIGLGADKARLSYEQFAAAQAKIKIITPEEQAAAEKFNENMAELSETWNTLITKAGVSLFPGISNDLQNVTWLVDKITELSGAYDKFMGKTDKSGQSSLLPDNPIFNLGFNKNAPIWRMLQGGGGGASPEGLSDMGALPGRASGGPVSGGQGYVVGERGPEFLVPGGGGNIMQAASFKQDQGGSGLEDFTRAIKSGTYDALVEWTSWLKTGEAAGAGAAGGFKTASFVTGGSGAGGATGGDPARGGAGVGTGPGGSTGGGSGPPGTSTGTGPGADPNSPEATQKGVPRNAQLSDEGGKVIDQQTMKQAEALGRSGDVKGLQTLFAQKGYRMSGPACGIVASGYTKSAGFKPPPGGAMASNWNDWAQPSSKEDINKEGRPFGSMVASYNERRYGGNIGAPLRKGEKGGHVMTIVPGTYNAKDNTAMFADQYGVRRRNIKNMDIRYAGDEAVAAAAARRGETVAKGPKGTQVASLPPDTATDAGGDRTASPRPPGATLPQPGAAGAPQIGAGGGADYLAQQRKKFEDEYKNDPALKERVAALATLENEGDPAVVESLYNRADMLGKTVRQSIGKNSQGKSFYGPVNRNLVEGRLAELKRDPERFKRAMETVDRARSSNLTKGNTDQGSAGDPNFESGGTGVNRKGGREVPAGTPGAERYNLYGGARNRRAREYRDRQQAAVAHAEARGPIARQQTGLRSGGGYTLQGYETENAPKRTFTSGEAVRGGVQVIDGPSATNRIDQAVAPPPINANGKVDVTINSNGTAAKAEAKADGMFQETKVTQHKQMEDTSMLGAP